MGACSAFVQGDAADKPVNRTLKAEQGRNCVYGCTHDTRSLLYVYLPIVDWAASGAYRGGGVGRGGPRSNREGGRRTDFPGGSILGAVCNDIFVLQEDAGQVRRHVLFSQVPYDGGGVVLRSVLSIERSCFLEFWSAVPVAESILEVASCAKDSSYKVAVNVEVLFIKGVISPTSASRGRFPHFALALTKRECDNSRLYSFF